MAAFSRRSNRAASQGWQPPSDSDFVPEPVADLPGAGFTTSGSNLEARDSRRAAAGDMVRTLSPLDQFGEKEIMMHDIIGDSTGIELRQGASHLVEQYLRLNGFFTFRSATNGARPSRSSAGLVALRLPFSTGFVLAPDPELALSPDAIEVLIAILDTDGSIVDAEIRDPGTLEWALLRLGCCQGDPQTMAMTLVRSGRAVSFLGENRLRARIFVFGDGPAPTRYEMIPFEHVTQFVHLHKPVQERLDGADAPDSLMPAGMRGA